MYFDLEDYRPDTPRVPHAISIREGVLMSIILHLLFVMAWWARPDAAPAPDAAQALVVPQKDPVTFVHIEPRVERSAPPKPNVAHSDLDRRATAPEITPPTPAPEPMSRGNTPEKTLGAPDERMAGAEKPATAPPPATTGAADIVTKPATTFTDPAPTAAPPAPTGNLGRSLRNLTRYLQDQSYDNQKGGVQDIGPDIQFDSKGVEFGPWLRRFIAQIKRNWYVPQAAMLMSGQVVIQFYVLKDGRITEIKVVKPSTTEAYTISAFNALKNSNPTLPLPPEYPDDRAFFTITFHYDVR
jgi:TonB family protein